MRVLNMTMVALLAASTGGALADGDDGKVLYEENCAKCHGINAEGTDKGPPFLHAVYKPDHHGDRSFQRAVAMGSPAHHWPFGDMLPVPGLTVEDVTKITAYVRDLQREAGF